MAAASRPTKQWECLELVIGPEDVLELVVQGFQALVHLFVSLVR